MPRFLFSVSSSGEVRQAGVVSSDSFDDALTAITEQVNAGHGDTLELGVQGFPPARLELAWDVEDGLNWRLLNSHRLAA